MTIDQQVLENAKNGDLAAFEEIVSAFERPLFNYSYRLCGHRQTAEDITQETFIKVYKNLANLDLEKNFSAWMYAIATNVSHDFLRKKKYVIEEPLENIPEKAETAGQDQDPYEQSAHNFDFSVIQQHLLQLKPVQRTVIILHYYKSFSLEEISRIVQLPVGTVKTHLFRGRNQLKKIIQAYESEHHKKFA